MPGSRSTGRAEPGLRPRNMRAGMGRSTSGAPRSHRKSRAFCRTRLFRARRAACRRSLHEDFFRAGSSPRSLGGRVQKTTSPDSSTRSHLRMICRARRRSERFSEVRPQWSSRSAFSSRSWSFLTQRTRRVAEDAEDGRHGGSSFAADDFLYATVLHRGSNPMLFLASLAPWRFDAVAVVPPNLVLLVSWWCNAVVVLRASSADLRVLCV